MSVLSRSRTTAPTDRHNRLHLPQQRPADEPLPRSSAPKARAPRRRGTALALAGLVAAGAAAAGAGAWTLLDDDGGATTPATTTISTSTGDALDAAAVRRHAADRRADLLSDRLSTEGRRDAARAGVLAP